MKIIAAMVLSDKGELLPYTCQGTMEQCEEEAPNVFAGEWTWNKLKELGAKVVQVEISTLEEVVDPRLKDWPPSTEVSRAKANIEGWECGYAEKDGKPNPYPNGSDEYEEWLAGNLEGYRDAVESWG
jgi:hypothetical protein